MKITEEIWKDVPGFEGEYEASTFGNIRSLKCGTKTMMKQSINGISHSKMSHEWICMTFNGIKPDGKNVVVNHKNGIKLDNRPENLEWVSQSMNSSHSATFNKKSGFIAHRSKLTPELVLEIYQKLFNGGSVIKLSVEYGVDRHAITHIKYKRFWSYILKDLPVIEKKHRQQGIKTRA